MADRSAGSGLPPSAGRVDSLTVMPTSRCNLACAYCYRGDGGESRLEWGRLRDCLAWALASPGGALEVMFSGGEPLLEFGMVRRAVEFLGTKKGARPVTARILSNGMLLDEERLAWLVEWDVALNLSFDGAPAAQDFRQPGSWAVLDGLLGLMAERHPAWFADRLQVTMTLTPSNLDGFAASVAYLVEKGVPAIGVSPALSPVPGWDDDLVADLDHQMARIYDDLLRHHGETGRMPLNAFRKYEDDPTEPGGPARGCAALTGAHPVLDADGELYSCLMFAPSGLDPANRRLRRVAEDLGFGREDRPGFEDRRASFAGTIRDLAVFTSGPDLESRYGRCRDCSAAPACRICPLSLLEFRGGTAPHLVPALLCAWNRIAAEYRGRFPAHEGKSPLREAVDSLRDDMAFWAARYRENPS